MDYKIWFSSLRWHGWRGEHTGIPPSSQNVSSLTSDQLIYYFIWGTIVLTKTNKQNRTKKLGLILLSHFSRVPLCVTPQTAAHQAPPSLRFSRQEHWSGLPFPFPMHESEKSKWSRSVVSDPQRPHGLQPSRILRPWDFPGKITGVGSHCLLRANTKNIFRMFLVSCLPEKITSSDF